MATLDEMLDRETDVSNTSWRKLAQIHYLLLAGATKHNDWTQAIRHLDELSELFRHADSPYANCENDDDIFESLCHYTVCYANSDDLEMATKYYAKAILATRDMDSGNQRLRERVDYVRREAPAVLAYSVFTIVAMRNMLIEYLR